MKGQEKISISESEYEELQNWRKIKPQPAIMFHAPRSSTTTTEPDPDLFEERDDVKKIYRYIQDNEKINKEKVVQAFEYSRKRVFKCIGILCNLGYVNARKDPITNRDYILTINEKSLLTSLVTQFQEMEIAYSTILHKLRHMRDIKHNRISLISTIFITFRHTIDEYFYRILLDWPEKTNDVIIRGRAQKIFFSSISKILSNIQDLTAEVGKDPGHAKNLTQFSMKVVLSPTLLAPHLIRRIMDLAVELGLKEEISHLLDFTWKTVSETRGPFVWPIDAIVRNWREYLSPRFKNYPRDRIISSSF